MMREKYWEINLRSNKKTFAVGVWNNKWIQLLNVVLEIDITIRIVVTI